MAINEVGRLVIVVPGGNGGAGLGEKYVAVALEDRHGQKVAESVTSFPEYAYSVIGRVCDSRAVETVGGTLKVNGKVMTPEAYLKLWRDAVANAVTPEQALQDCGVKVTLVVGGNSVHQAGMKRQWTTDPMDGFDGWAERYASRINPDADGYFSFEMDLGDPEAHHAWELMTRYQDYKDKDARLKREMRVVVVAAGLSEQGRVQNIATTDPAQTSLFA
jgi:hypothetical protein